MPPPIPVRLPSADLAYRYPPCLVWNSVSVFFESLFEEKVCGIPRLSTIPRKSLLNPICQIGAVADADNSLGRVSTQHVSWERHRSHEGFKRPRRSGDNQAPN